MEDELPAQYQPRLSTAAYIVWMAAIEVYGFQVRIRCITLGISRVSRLHVQGQSTEDPEGPGLRRFEEQDHLGLCGIRKVVQPFVPGVRELGHVRSQKCPRRPRNVGPGGTSGPLGSCRKRLAV